MASDGFAQVGNVGIRANRVAEAFDGKDVERLTIGDMSNADELLDEMAAAFREGKVFRPFPKGTGDVPLDLLMRIIEKSGEAEQRAARSLGIPISDLAAFSAKLWGRSYSEERDRRAGAEAQAQKRGRIGRELRTELREAMGNGDDKQVRN